MWQVWVENGQQYLVNVEIGKSGYVLVLFDFHKFYVEEVCEESALQRLCAQFNPSFETNVSAILALFEKIDSSSTSILVKSQDEEKLQILFSVNVDGVTFRWTFNPSITPNYSFREKMLEPLLSIINILLQKEEQLKSLLVLKDKEIHALEVLSGNKSNIKTDTFTSDWLKQQPLELPNHTDVLDIFSRSRFKDLYTEFQHYKEKAEINKRKSQATELQQKAQTVQSAPIIENSISEEELAKRKREKLAADLEAERLRKEAKKSKKKRLF